MKTLQFITSPNFYSRIPFFYSKLLKENDFVLGVQLEVSLDNTTYWYGDNLISTEFTKKDTFVADIYIGWAEKNDISV